MSDSIDRLLAATSFAARAHRHQIRKDGQTPYVAHPFRVCLIVRHVFGIDDPEFLMAALLHDTIEDTTTDFDDLSEAFGEKVAGYVAALSKDTRLPDEPREEAYMANLAAAPAPVKVSKLADIYDNLRDSKSLSPTQRERTIGRSLKYLDALENGLPEVAQKPMGLVRKLIEEMRKEDRTSRIA